MTAAGAWDVPIFCFQAQLSKKPPFSTHAPAFYTETKTSLVEFLLLGAGNHSEILGA